MSVVNMLMGGPLAFVAVVALLTAAIRHAATKHTVSTGDATPEILRDPIPPGYTRYTIPEQSRPSK